MADTVLVVDDEESILRLVSFNLKRDGYEVIEGRTGDEAIELTAKTKPDVIILDLMLPGMDGLSVFRALRERGYDVPVIFLTARGSELDRVLGLELGADDYVTKPFSPRELVARVRAVLRRFHPCKSVPPMNTEEGDRSQARGRIKWGDLIIDEEARTVELRSRTIPLTTKEFELLAFMARHPGRVFTREALLNRVWGYEYPGDTRVVDVHISHLRDKVEDDARNPQYIKTVRGVGYKFGEKSRSC